MPQLKVKSPPTILPTCYERRFCKCDIASGGIAPLLVLARMRGGAAPRIAASFRLLIAIAAFVVFVFAAIITKSAHLYPRVFCINP